MTLDVLLHARIASQQLKSASSLKTYSQIPFLSGTENAEDWLRYEQLFYSSLSTGDDESALLSLTLLERRFGEDNDRLSGLRGMLREAQASTQQLESILRDYDKDMQTNSVNIPLTKRRIALLQSLGKNQEAVVAMCQLLDLNPTDAEAWSELAQLYFLKGYLKQALFCLEEVLLTQPNSWNAHARLGELYLRMTTEDGSIDAQSIVGLFQEAVQHFCRSIELCDDYIRGYCGLRQSSVRMLRYLEKYPQIPTKISTNEVSDLVDRATSKLESFVRSYETRSVMPADVLAAKAILKA